MCLDQNNNKQNIVNEIGVCVCVWFYIIWARYTFLYKLCGYMRFYTTNVVYTLVKQF